MNNAEDLPQAKYTLNVKPKKTVGLSPKKIWFYIGGLVATVTLFKFLVHPVWKEWKMREAERCAEFIQETSKHNDDEYS